MTDPHLEAMPKVPRLEHRKGWAIPVEVEEQQLEASPEVLVLRRRQTDRLRERVLGTGLPAFALLYTRS